MGFWRPRGPTLITTTTSQQTTTTTMAAEDGSGAALERYISDQMAGLSLAVPADDVSGPPAA